MNVTRWLSVIVASPPFGQTGEPARLGVPPDGSLSLASTSMVTGLSVTVSAKSSRANGAFGNASTSTVTVTVPLTSLPLPSVMWYVKLTGVGSVILGMLGVKRTELPSRVVEPTPPAGWSTDRRRIVSLSGSMSLTVTGIFTELPITTLSVSGLATGGRLGAVSSIFTTSTLPVTWLTPSLKSYLMTERVSAPGSTVIFSRWPTTVASTPLGSGSGKATNRSSPSWSVSLALTSSVSLELTRSRMASGSATGGSLGASLLVTSTVTFVGALVPPLRIGRLVGEGVDAGCVGRRVVLQGGKPGRPERVGDRGVAVLSERRYRQHVALGVDVVGQHVDDNWVAEAGLDAVGLGDGRSVGAVGGKELDVDVCGGGVAVLVDDRVRERVGAAVPRFGHVGHRAAVEHVGGAVPGCLLDADSVDGDRVAVGIPVVGRDGDDDRGAGAGGDRIVDGVRWVVLAVVVEQVRAGLVAGCAATSGRLAAVLGVRSP